MKGFTFIEFLLVVGIFFILVAVFSPIYGQFQVSGQLNENSSLAIQFVRTARERSVARLNNSSHGVYFEINEGSDDRIILYQGPSFLSRENIYDKEISLGSVLSLLASDFSLTAGKDVDVNFSKGLGIPDNTGTITMTHEVSGVRLISINSIGMVEEN